MNFSKLVQKIFFAVAELLVSPKKAMVWSQNQNIRAFTFTFSDSQFPFLSQAVTCDSTRITTTTTGQEAVPGTLPIF